MKLVYFASVREAIGLSSEDRDIPCDARTVGDFVIWLRGQSQEHAVALISIKMCFHHNIAIRIGMVFADSGTMIIALGLIKLITCVRCLRKKLCSGFTQSGYGIYLNGIVVV